MRKPLIRNMAATLAALGLASAFAASDIAYKYDTSGRSGTIIEPTGTAEKFDSFDSRTTTTAAWDQTMPTVLVQYFSVFESNVAEILTSPPGLTLLFN